MKYVIGIGAQKAGTTSLAAYFTKHPEVCFSPRKELHYFDAKYLSDLCGTWDHKFQMEAQKPLLRRKIKWFLRTGIGAHSMTYSQFLRYRIGMVEDENLYKAYFEKLNPGLAYCSECTPSYSMLGIEGFKAMRDLLPGVKVIFIMRNPVDRYWSHLKHMYTRGYSIDFVSESLAKLSDPQYFLRTDYKRTIKAAEAVFPAQDVLLLFYEKLFFEERKLEYFNKIPDFLGIKRMKPSLEKIRNKSKDVAQSKEERRALVEALKHVYEYVVDRFEDVPDSWVKDFSLIET